MSPKDNRIVLFVSKLREKAESLRAGKTIAAQQFMAGAEEGLDQVDGWLNFYAAYVRVLQSSSLAVRKIFANPTVRTMTERLVANVVDDLASRTNEVATLVEAASKEPSVINAINDAEAAGAEFAAAMERINRIVKRGRGNFTVVRDDEAESQDQDKQHSVN